MTKIKVAHLIIGMNVGGAERHLIDVASHLSQSDIESLIIVLKGPGELSSEARERSIRVVYLNATGAEPSLPFKVRSILQSQEIHILHSHLFKADLVARLASIGWQGKLICTKESTDSWMKGYHILLEQITSVRVNEYVACSAAVRDSFRARNMGVTKRWTVAYNGTPISRFAPKRSRVMKRRLYCVGRLDIAHKGQDTFLLAVAELNKRGLFPEWIIAGDGKDRARLATQANNLRITETGKFLGTVKDLASLYEGGGILVHPAREEGFGIVLVEAMAAGLPIVASNVGGIPEVVGNAGVLIPPDDHKLLAQKIFEILSSDEEWRRMSHAGSERSKRFSIESAATTLSHVYKRLRSALDDSDK